MKEIAKSICVPAGTRIGAKLNHKPPVDFVSAFNVDTISADLSWTDTNNGADAYEIYRSTNGGTEALITTTDVGATSYSDAGCKQNASVVYRIKAVEGSKSVNAAALSTPLCWKTNQTVLTSVVIGVLNIQSGKTITVNWGDGTSQAYSGSNSNITKNYAATGQYNISMSGDTDFISQFYLRNQSKIYGDTTNWVIASGTSEWVINDTLLSGNWESKLMPLSLLYLNLQSTEVGGTLPSISGSTTGMIYIAATSYFTGSNMTVFRKGMTNFNISSQKTVFPTSEIDKLLKALADWYEVNAPTASVTINMSGTNMGIPTGGSDNVDLVRLVGYYTTASKSCTVLVRTS